MRALTKEQFIEKARKIHGDKYDYSQVEYINNATYVTIICPIHGPFQQRPTDHLNGRGCRKCANEQMSLRFTDTTESFIIKARAKHGNRYDYSQVDYKKRIIPVAIICPNHGVFMQKPSEHLTGCGCPKCAEEIHRTHGQSHSRLYRIYYTMLQRCTNRRSSKYKDYGGRGISICDEWRYSYENFRDWAMSNGYNEFLSIDRIDVNGNYTPENCRWADNKTQMMNRRNTLIIHIKGVPVKVNELAEVLGINRTTLAYYCNMGEEALLTFLSEKYGVRIIIA